MRIAIIQFPGSNCERETMLAVKRAGMEPEEFLWNASRETLSAYAGFILVGGFSYEDRSRAGIIAALDPLVSVLKEQSELGKPILGICNGAQILVETGLVPGLSNYALAMALTDNKRMQQGQVVGTGFYNAWVSMRLADHYQLNAFTRLIPPKHIFSVPVAHAEGRFVIPPVLLEEMKKNGQTVFQYCDEAGATINEFPTNPNGSIENIAAVSNKMGNVMAMMPHPERTEQGDLIFQSMRDYIESGYVQRINPMHYKARRHPITAYKLPAQTHQLLVSLVITDNHALTVENTLKQHGLSVGITRYFHWEITAESYEVIEKIKASGVLFNDRKEQLISRSAIEKTGGVSLLVQAKDDMIGREKLQLLKNQFGIRGVSQIRYGVMWHIADPACVEPIINSTILFNPYAHDCYYYQ
jgi:phosphoribosylformylglycinamidine synthase subunit PurQ / glutaminase